MITVPWVGEKATLDGLPHPSRNHGVLVVDDDKDMRGVLNIWLRHQGFGVWIAATGAEAVEVYTHHRDSISVVLMDVHMPTMDGPQTLVALRQINPQVRCCFMSGKLNGYTEMGLLDMGAQRYLQKPFQLVDLEAILWKLAEPVERQSSIQDDFWRDDGGQG